MKKITLKGNINGKRTPSRIFEEEIQEAVRQGARELHIIADGQHGIGGRIWPRGEVIKITVEGPVGQRRWAEAWEYGNVWHRNNN
ncbi:MAG: hypothetical protein HY753_01180 [Nitrospirae bacterium]|nr:hypothetical protein [Nitrospirota bacterium]